MALLTRSDVGRFVRSLHLPEDRAEILEAELVDHIESAMQAAGADALREEDALAIAEGLLGPAAAKALRRVEPAFGLRPGASIARGALAGAVYTAVTVTIAIGLEAPPLPGYGFQALGILLVPLILLFLPPGYSALIRGALRASRKRPRRWAEPAFLFLASFMVSPLPLLLALDLIAGIGDPAEALLVPTWLALFAHLWIQERRVRDDLRALARR